MTDDLQRIFNARSLAVIGASNDLSKRGGQAIRQLLDDGYRGSIFPINPKTPEIQGLPAYPSVTEVADTIDLALVCTPAKTLPAILDQCGEKGIPGAVVLAAGFAESGEEGARLAAAALDTAHRHGVRVIGPNTNGVFNLHANMNLVGVKDARLGDIGVVSQSGNMSLALIMEARRRDGIGFSTYIGVGNQLDIRFDEYLDYFRDDENTRVPIVYAEGFKDGARFLEACRSATQKKPVVVYKSGRTAAGQTAALSHTGSLAGSFELTRDLLHQAGATVVDASDKILSVAEGLSKMPVVRGDRIAILADGGGHATITADSLIERGLRLAELSERTRARLAESLPPAAALGNPVDVAGGTDDDPSRFADCTEALLQDDGVDILMIVGMFGGYAARFDPSLLDLEIETARKLSDVAARTGKPVVVQSVFGTTVPEPLKALRASGVPLFIWAENAVRAVAEAVRYARAKSRIAKFPRREAGPPNAETARLIATARQGGRESLFEHEAKSALRHYGITVPGQAVVRSQDDIAALSPELTTRPLALKIVSEDILHKSDARCVELNVTGESAVREAVSRIISNAKAYDPNARIEGVLATPMVAPGVEVIIGVTRDPIFGPVMMFGLGGIFVEVLKDVSFRALPMSEADAREMIEGIKSAKILSGVRGARPVDQDALADLIMKVGVLALAHPDIAEIDLNPVIVRHDGYDVVDARMILDKTEP